MRSIAMLGSEEQRQRWLPGMARVDLLGAFALTEPDHGSDAVALGTTATPDGEAYRIDGAKRWTGNGTIADVLVPAAANVLLKARSVIAEPATCWAATGSCSRTT